MKADPLHHFRNAGLEERYKRRGKEAERGLPSSCVVLKCIECSGLEYSAAKNCEITTCPLYPLNVRFIKKKSLQKQASAGRRRERAEVERPSN